MKRENIIKKQEILDEINLLNADGVDLFYNKLRVGDQDELIVKNICKTCSKHELSRVYEDWIFEKITNISYWNLKNGQKISLPYSEPKSTKTFTTTAISIDTISSLTDEKIIIEQINNYLAEAYNLFLDLDSQHPNEKEDFVKGIHQCQYVLGMRIAREYRPDLFPLKKE